MSEDGGGEKTEKPTAKRLRDARAKGDVSKSKDLTDTATLFAAVCVIVFAGPWGVARLAGLLDHAITLMERDPGTQIPALLVIGASVTAILFVAGAALPLLIAIGAELMQVGPLLTTEKLKFDLKNLNPATGMKKLFSAKNLVETFKSIVKVVLILLISYYVILSDLNSLFSLPWLPAQKIGLIWSTISIRLIQSTVLVFLAVSVVDHIYQKHSFIKKMKMSIKDIKDEHKNSEGDPMMKSSRKQMHQEISAAGARSAARSATVLIANPTHYTVTLDYDPSQHAAPIMTARGAGRLALAMREIAEEAGVPIVVKPDLARGLFARGTIGEVIPDAFFVPIAEIIAWAKKLSAATDTPTEE